jgi:hypothetical protein
MGIAALIIVAAAGCQQQQQPSEQAESPAQTDAPAPIAPTAEQQPLESQPRAQPTRKIDQMDADAGSADLLARKTEAYSLEVAQMLQTRGKGQPSPIPSEVQWLDPNELRLGGDSTSQMTSGGNLDESSNGPSLEIKPAVDTSRIATANVQPVVLAPSEAQPPSVPGTVAATPRANAAIPPISSDALEEKLAQRVRDYPRDVSAHLEHQLLQFLKDEPTPQLSVLASLPVEDREVVTALLDGLANFRNALRADSNMLMSRKIKPILEMSERLRSQADLTIPAIALCRAVNGFGSYDPFDPARFAAGRDQPVIVYCEIANFTSHLNDRQLWETRLTWDLTLYAENGMSVWSDKTETIADTARNQRRDFFVRKMITLPSTLPIGRYLLKCSIIDTQSNRVAEATAPLIVAAQ